jgi:predicted TIM-barrel fold metal-dependent hydrolase
VTVVDCAVHPVLEDGRLKRALGPPWSLAKLPHLLGDVYAAPFDQLAGRGDEAADPGGVARLVLDDWGASFALLTPSTRGWYPNPQQAAAVARAANRLLRDDWLDDDRHGGRFLGSIRVPLQDAAAAAAEIAAWADDPRYVQVVVPLRADAPLGDERFLPIWRVAAERGLVVYVHDDPGWLTELPPTPVGFPRSFAEHHALRPLLVVVHLASLVTCGVFDRLPDLRVVFGDGGIDLARALLYRLDKDWRAGRTEIPWVTGFPSSYVERHARFVTQPEDSTADGVVAVEALADDAASLLLFGSRYPYWEGVGGARTAAAPNGRTRADVLGRNALAFYPRLRAAIDAAGCTS